MKDNTNRHNTRRQTERYSREEKSNYTRRRIAVGLGALVAGTALLLGAKELDKALENPYVVPEKSIDQIESGEKTAEELGLGKYTVRIDDTLYSIAKDIYGDSAKKDQFSAAVQEQLRRDDEAFEAGKLDVNDEFYYNLPEDHNNEG